MVRTEYLARGSVMRVEDARSSLIHVCDGAVWITQEDDERDYFVPAGKSFRVTRAGLTLVSALRASAIALTGSMQQSTREVGHATESAAS